MTDKRFTRYWLWSCIGVLLASFYPLTMGVRVIVDMLRDGLVYQENYPKYIIPYTPIAVAVILGVALMPLFFKWLKRYALLGGAALSAAVFGRGDRPVGRTGGLADVYVLCLTELA